MSIATTSPPRPRKLIELDTVRGLAALVVFADHFACLVPSIAGSLEGTPLFGCVNGLAAVIVFFVLSGFVLALQPLQTRRWASLLALVLKRWPRLAGPVVVSGAVYMAFAALGAFPSPDRLAAAAPAYPFWSRLLNDDAFGSVLRETLFGTFFEGTAQHNPALWTMHWEFVGSFLVAGLAATLIVELARPVRAVLFVAGWAGSALCNPWLLAFPAGVAAAQLHGRFGTRLHIPGWLALPMVLAGAVLLSWDIRAQAGIWWWTAAIGSKYRVAAWVAAESVAAGCFMAAALYNPTARRLTSHQAGAFAGRVSFSFYLMHLAVLVSVMSWLRILLASAALHPIAGLIVFLVCLVLTTVLAIPLTMFDRWWRHRLDSVARGAAARFVSVGTGQPSALLPER